MDSQDNRLMLSTAVLRTLAYSNNFDYPLRLSEIRKYLISNGGKKVKIAKKSLLEVFTDFEQISTDGEYFFLKGREAIVELRKKREKVSRKKLLLAQKTAKKLNRFPFVKFIGLTGALSVGNADEDDDIDLMIITVKDRLWLTRMLIWLICPICQIRRRKINDVNVKDKICFNLFLDEAGLEIEEKNLFTAHEICQVKSLYNKDQTYEKFLAANSWVKEYLPNALSIIGYRLSATRSCLFLSLLNLFAFGLQYLYMKPKITNEKVTLHQAFFHPNNLSPKILRSGMFT